MYYYVCEFGSKAVIHHTPLTPLLMNFESKILHMGKILLIKVLEDEKLVSDYFPHWPIICKRIYEVDIQTER